MTRAHELATNLLAALEHRDREALAALLADDAGLRVHGHDSRELYRPREYLVRAFDEWWRERRIVEFSVLSVVAGDASAAAEFRFLEETDDGEFEHDCALFVTPSSDGRAGMLDLYRAVPRRAVRRGDWRRPAPADARALQSLIVAMENSFDMRRVVPINQAFISTDTLARGGSLGRHPAGNVVQAARFTAEEADARIEEVIAWHAARNIGFHWRVGPLDTPWDLATRLEREGLVFAGDQALMMRAGLDAAEIATNPAVVVRPIDPGDDAAIEASLEITAICFQWTPEITEAERPGWFDDIRHPERSGGQHYLALLEGRPVGHAAWFPRAGMAYLGGAATLPAFRRRKVYSTLLRARLDDAHRRGFAVATIHAEPMSRRVVAKYGFREIARYLVYGWMPEIDVDVIRTIVQDQ